MLTVGLVGTRGLVGSVLLQRMTEENDFASIRPQFFSSSQTGKGVPQFAHLHYRDAYDLNELAAMDVIITCQGSAYTQAIYQSLREQGWQGYFIDAASHLRLADDAMICLDPVNGALLDQALAQGIKTFVGSNCTVSLMLMAMSQVIESGLVESLSAMTYQAASGAGSQGIADLLQEMHDLSELSM